MKDLLIKTNNVGFIGDNNLLKQTKEEAVNAIGILKFPSRKDEAWKYTNLNKLKDQQFVAGSLLPSAKLNDFIVAGLKANILVFVNGHYSAEQSTILEENNDLTIGQLKTALNDNSNDLANYFGKSERHKNELFTALNTLNSTDGVLITVKENAVIEHPIHIINITIGDKIVSHPRNLIVAEKNSIVTIIASYDTEVGSSLTNAVCEIVVKENSMVDYYLLQNESIESTQINDIAVVQNNSSTFSITTITTNGGLVRNNLKIWVDGSHCETRLYGLYFTIGKQHVDNHTFVDHIKPNCMSDELYKGVMNDESTGVFNGKVFVHREAQKTNAFQSNKNILLTDDATINSKPELEIYADDVKCSHGSTTGQFDDEALFYLRARGIMEDTARKMLLEAFADDVLANIKIAPLKEMIEDRLNASFK
ncbi:MAG: Fe-S cluster assembly protein SufD [Flavobacteriales bacterium]|nr:Fe-S cluster assembly protein SufD [Flavobacteriales bacterium]